MASYSSTLARYGGEEFAIIVPNLEKQNASLFAESLRKAIEDERIEHGSSSVGPVVTISVGVYTCVPTTSITVEEIINQADKALYASKSLGRNCVTCV